MDSNGGVPRAFVAAGNAERYLMEADALRRRQLCAALLHGTGRSWRYRRRVWIAALAGAVVVAVVVAVIGVANAFARQTRINQEEERRRQAAAGTAPPWPVVTRLTASRAHRVGDRHGQDGGGSAQPGGDGHAVAQLLLENHPYRVAV